MSLVGQSSPRAALAESLKRAIEAARSEEDDDTAMELEEILSSLSAGAPISGLGTIALKLPSQLNALV